jgi:hypothetical protein
MAENCSQPFADYLVGMLSLSGLAKEMAVPVATPLIDGLEVEIAGGRVRRRKAAFEQLWKGASECRFAEPQALCRTRSGDIARFDPDE